MAVLKEIVKWLERSGHKLTARCKQLINDKGFVVPTASNTRTTGPARFALREIFLAAGLIRSGLANVPSGTIGQVDLSLDRACKVAKLKAEEDPEWTFAIELRRNANHKDRVLFLNVAADDRMPLVVVGHVEKLKRMTRETTNKALRLLEDEEHGPPEVRKRIAAWKVAGCQDVLLIDLPVASGTFRLES
ncbi:hypothetical protein BCR44DRAFT_36291 [Catenaria anguillulae PL171]|uniref:Uncharacterized protein n=1 Tax=Catenaria anguillulae PL171 TaxID=765915 RepID=A0A1Y2HPU4_9FUNG|nr:hypothetical protein BCR44DRAFT_36291 [Catenaria anguillulae PL171]